MSSMYTFCARFERASSDINLSLVSHIAHVDTHPPKISPKLTFVTQYSSQAVSVPKTGFNHSLWRVLSSKLVLIL